MVRRGPIRVAPPFAVVALGVGLLAATGCSRQAKVTYPVVPTTLVLRSTTTTTLGPDRSKLTLPTIDVPATTTTIGFRRGTASVEGVVRGPDGPVAGAKVRIERLVGSQTAVRIVGTDGQGRYVLSGVELGRLRVRAWRPPDLAMMSDELLFASKGTSRDLELTGFGRTEVQWAMAPATPFVGRKVNVVIQVSTRVVGSDGLITIEPLSGVGVSIFPTGTLVPLAAGERLTDEAGRAVFTLRCDADGDGGLDVRLATGGQAILSPPPCRTPATTVPATPVPVVDPTATTITPPVNAVTTLVPNPDDTATSLVPVPVVPQPVGRLPSGEF